MMISHSQRSLHLFGTARRVIGSFVWGHLVLFWCRTLRIHGLHNVPHQAVLIAANHSSHADTVLLQFALSLRHRRPVLVAGAEDYWFSDPLLAAGATSIGVFPFPRHGDAGIRRARKALRMQATVLVYPQGTRAGGRFRSGVGRIAADGLTDVVPVYISGTEELLPRGRQWPRRSSVKIVFGESVRRGQSETAQEFADRLGHTVMHDLARAS